MDAQTTASYDDQLLERRKRSLARMDHWAFVLDDAIPIPGTRFSVGVDSVVGLLPGIGDFAGLALSSGLIGEAFWARAPKRIWVPMTANVGLDFAIGVIPVLGDIFDVAYQANTRNARLFRRWLETETQTQPQDESSQSSRVSVTRVSGGLIVVVVVGFVAWQLWLN